MQFRHDRLALELDEATGSILSITDVVSGRVHLAASAHDGAVGRLFRVILPIERWSSHAADSWLTDRPDIEESGTGIVIRWPDLHTPAGPAGVAAELRIDRGGSSEAILRLRLASHRTAGDLTDVLFPWLCGWQPSGSPTDAIVLGGYMSVSPGTFPINRGMTFSRWHQRSYATYPIEMYAPWVDLSGRNGGIGLISYQQTARNIGAFLENLAAYGPGLDLSAGLNHSLLLRDGDMWESPPIGISVHEGDWHATADRYSDWVDTWFQPPPTPEWARQSIGFQNVLFRGFDGTPIRPLEAIPEVAAAGVKAGVPHLCVWDYVLLGDYGKLDDVPPHGFADGDRERMRAAVAAARAAGARLSSLQNYRLVKPTSSLYRDGGHEEVCRRYDGSPFVEEYCGSLAHAMVITTQVGPMVHPVDARLPSVQRRVLDLVRDSVDLGFDSHFYDQPFEQWPSYHPERGADGPDGAHAATVEMLRSVRRLLAADSPDGIVMGEYCDVFASEAVDLWMSWYTDFEDLRRSLYAIPQTMQSWVVDADASAATRAFVVGAQLCLTTHGGEGHLADVPGFAAHVAGLAALRARSERLWRGRYRGVAGFELADDGPVTAASFFGPAGSAVVVGSPGAPGRATLTLDRARMPRNQGGGRLLRVDGRTYPVDGDVVEVVLAADEVAILET